MNNSALDKPWKRPGRLAYTRRRWAAALRPPVTVYPMPANVTKHEDVPVQMPDGVTLRLNLFLPGDIEGPFPVIMSAHPYGKDAVPKRRLGRWSLNPQFRIMNQTAPLRISDQTSWEAPDPAWWAQQGYAVINMDTRGGGRSDGRGTLFSNQEADDISQVIAWAAAQPWSTGRIGMLGVSYLALSQYKVAALNPPALKAICPWEGFTDAYRDFFTPGGVVENGFARIWLLLSARVARLDGNFAAERRKHPLRDAWWEAITPDLSKITVPILECASFSDANLHSVGSMRAFQRVSSVDRYAYTHRGSKWATFYSDEARRHQLAFFDRHLRGRDVPRLPRIRLEIRDRLDHVTEVRDEQEWPLARTDWRALHLSDGGLLTEADAGEGSVTIEGDTASSWAARFIEKIKGADSEDEIGQWDVANGHHLDRLQQKSVDAYNKVVLAMDERRFEIANGKPVQTAGPHQNEATPQPDKPKRAKRSLTALRPSLFCPLRIFVGRSAFSSRENHGRSRSFCCI